MISHRAGCKTRDIIYFGRGAEIFSWPSFQTLARGLSVLLLEQLSKSISHLLSLSDSHTPGPLYPWHNCPWSQMSDKEGQQPLPNPQTFKLANPQGVCQSLLIPPGLPYISNHLQLQGAVTLSPETPCVALPVSLLYFGTLSFIFLNVIVLSPASKRI